MLEAEEMDEILSGIRSDDAKTRDLAADSVTDIARALSPQQTNEIARSLVAAAVQEEVEDCRESELNALDDLTGWHPIDRDLLRPVLDIERTGLGVSEQEYLDNLARYVSGEA